MLAGIRLPDSWLAAPITLWRFSRPHTLVGTTTSILGIYAIAAAELPGVALGDGVADLALTVLAGAAFVPVGLVLHLRARRIDRG